MSELKLSMTARKESEFTTRLSQGGWLSGTAPLLNRSITSGKFHSLSGLCICRVCTTLYVCGIYIYIIISTPSSHTRDWKQGLCTLGKHCITKLYPQPWICYFWYEETGPQGERKKVTVIQHRQCIWKCTLI